MGVLVSCKKEDTLITGNEAPEDPTVSNTLKENFVQKSYLNLFGRQPSDSDMTAALTILNKNNCSVANRTEMLNMLFTNPEYRVQLYEIEINNMLNGLTETEIKQTVKYYQDELNDPDNAPDYFVLLDALNKTKALDSLKEQVVEGTAGTIKINQVISASPSYEDLTGGGSEWVSALFVYFLFRDPTENELLNCEEMLDNRSGTLFHTEGNNKDELLHIFFSSDEYFEGQVRALFHRYLYTEPGSDETVSLAHTYIITHDYYSLQKSILLKDGFLGIKQ